MASQDAELADPQNASVPENVDSLPENVDSLPENFDSLPQNGSDDIERVLPYPQASSIDAEHFCPQNHFEEPLGQPVSLTNHLAYQVNETNYALIEGKKDAVSFIDGTWRRFNGKKWMKICLIDGCTNLARRKGGLCDKHFASESSAASSGQSVENVVDPVHQNSHTPETSPPSAVFEGEVVGEYNVIFKGTFKGYFLETVRENLINLIEADFEGHFEGVFDGSYDGEGTVGLDSPLHGRFFGQFQGVFTQYQKEQVHSENPPVYA